MSKILVVVDMQNDFLTGMLANPDACNIVPNICKAIDEFDMIFYTLDTHNNNYLNTQEGRNLPIPHCICGTNGHELEPNISRHINNKNSYDVYCFEKENFTPYWPTLVIDLDTEFYFCGTCTDICVISSALSLKALYPENKIYVYANLCAGTTRENHEAALKVMRSCQIEVINYDKQD